MLVELVFIVVFIVLQVASLFISRDDPLNGITLVFTVPTTVLLIFALKFSYRLTARLTHHEAAAAGWWALMSVVGLIVLQNTILSTLLESLAGSIFYLLIPGLYVACYLNFRKSPAAR
jgi:hypothetical protein